MQILGDGGKGGRLGPPVAKHCVEFVPFIVPLRNVPLLIRVIASPHGEVELHQAPRRR